MVKDMNRRYPPYQAGGEVPSDIRRLVSRMLGKAKDHVTSLPRIPFGQGAIPEPGAIERARSDPQSRLPIQDYLESGADLLRDLAPLQRLKTGARKVGGGISDLLEDFADSPYAERFRGGNLPPNVMRSSSGGMISGYAPGGPVQQRKVESFVSPEQAQLSAQLTGNIQNIASQPYQAYGGQRLAGTTQDQALARSAYGAYGRGTGPAGTQQAADAYTQAQGMVGGAAEGLQGLQPQYGQLAQQFSQGAQGAQQQSQANAQQMQNLAGTAQMQGQLAGAGMRNTGTESQQQAGQAATAMRGVGQQMGAPKMQTQANMQDYMSQYGKGVTDPQLEALREFQQIQGQELGSQAATSGNLGSMRQGVQAAQQARDVSQQASDIIGGQQQKAFESAQQAFQADRSAQQAGLGQQLTAEQQAAQAQSTGQQQALTAQQQGYQAAQGGTELGLQAQRAAQAAQQQGYGTMGSMLGQQQGAVDAQGKALGQVAQMGGQMANIAGGMGTQAQREQQMQMQRLQGMEQAGARTQQEQQRDLDLGYQDFQEQRDHTQQQTQTALNMSSQLPYQNTQVISDYKAEPGFMSDVTGAVGAYKDYQSGQETTPDPNAVDPDAEATVYDDEGNPTGSADLYAGGGYIGASNLGILAPYHQKLIDGLYAGGRIHYQ